jgi:hypothetical protein
VPLLDALLSVDEHAVVASEPNASVKSMTIMLRMRVDFM